MDVSILWSSHSHMSTDISLIFRDYQSHARIQREGDWGSEPLTPGKSQTIRFLSNTDLDPLENNKIQFGLAIIGQPFKWRFAGGPMIVRFLVVFGFFLPSSIYKKG